MAKVIINKKPFDTNRLNISEVESTDGLWFDMNGKKHSTMGYGFVITEPRNVPDIYVQKAWSLVYPTREEATRIQIALIRFLNNVDLGNMETIEYFI